MEIENSILNEVKKVMGIQPSVVAFDTDIIMHINAAFSILNQLGAGPEEGFTIQDKETTWDEYFTDKRLTMIESYVYSKVRMLFDPPANSFTVTALMDNIAQLEWRIKAQYEMMNLDKEDGK